MKLKDYKESINFYSGKASELNRQFTFAGIAVVWIVSSAQSDILQLRNFIFPLVTFILSLFFDLLQYSLGYLIWRRFYRQQERSNILEEDDVSAPVSYDHLLNSIWGLKIVATLIGFFCLAFCLVKLIY